MPIYSMTKEEQNKMELECKEQERIQHFYKNVSEMELWFTDMRNLKNKLKL